VANTLYQNVRARIHEGHSDEEQAREAAPSHKHLLRFRKSRISKWHAEHARDIQAARELINTNQEMLDDLDVSTIV